MPKLFIIIFILLFSLLVGNFSLAYCEYSGNRTDTAQSSCTGVGYKWINEPGATFGTVSLDNPLGKGATDIPTLLGKIIQSVLGVVGSLALVMFIYGGTTWMLSGGNQERVTKGKQILIWATLGIIIIFSAYALVR